MLSPFKQLEEHWISKFERRTISQWERRLLPKRCLFGSNELAAALTAADIAYALHSHHTIMETLRHMRLSTASTAIINEQAASRQTI